MDKYCYPTPMVEEPVEKYPELEPPKEPKMDIDINFLWVMQQEEEHIKEIIKGGPHD